MEKRKKIVNEGAEKFTTLYWRERFRLLDIEAGTYDLRDIGVHNAFFLSARGKAALSNVKRGIGGLLPTMYVVQALEIFVDSKNATKKNEAKLLKNQKLIMT